jgi:hypothetical protein
MSEVTVGMAVMSLRPGAEWTMSDNDVENITWHTEGVTPLTQAEVDAEVARLEQQAIDDAAAREAALESGRAKLLALGLTEDEVAAMTSG